MATPADKPRRPVNEMLKIFAEQTEEDMVINFMTQRIWPYEVYPGYREVAKRRKHGNDDAHPNGEGVKSFNVYVENDDPFQMTLVAEYNDYLKYVDLGVGGWGGAHDIDRARKAKWDKRYNKWNVGNRKTSRPAILMQFRHVLTRMRNYAVDFYGYEGLGKVIPMVDDIVIDLWGEVFNFKEPEKLK